MIFLLKPKHLVMLLTVDEYKLLKQGYKTFYSTGYTQQLIVRKIILALK